MFLPPSKYSTSQLCSLAAAHELATLTDNRVVRLIYWDPKVNKARVQGTRGKPWTIKKQQIATIQCSFKVAHELDLRPRTS